MSLWLSGGNRTVTQVDDTGSGSGGGGGSTGNNATDISTRVQDVVVDTVVDDDGQFELDLTQLVDFTVQEVLSVQVFVLDQTLTPLTDLATLLLAQVIEVTNNVIRGVLITIATLTALGTEIVERAGAGETVRVLMTLRR